MKCKFTLVLIALFFIGNSFAQKPEQAPFNDEFIKFIKEGPKSKGNYIIPLPTTYVFSDKINEKIKEISFPSTYNLNTLGYVSSVKDQGNAGHCWSFAAIGAVESRNLKLGLGTYNLSEHNMATCHGFEWHEGGNQAMAIAYLSRLSGPLLESQDVYIDDDFNCSATGIAPQFYITENRYLPRNPDVIKYYLMNYGAIAVSYYTPNDPVEASLLYKPDNTFYYSGSENPNHAVLLVGWDDNKSTSGGTGAWIIKNSWGALWGDNGYFYMSYKDTHALRNATIYPIRKELDDIDTLLMIDKFGQITSYGFRDQEDYGLIKYSISEEHSFTQIGTYVGASNSIIDIEVFSTKTGDVLTDTLAKSYENFAEFPGYYTFDIPFTTTGDFYIKVKYRTPGYNYPIPVEMASSGYVSPTIESGVCWISDEADEWVAIGSGTDVGADLCIRAYGTKNALKAAFTANRKTICYDTDITFTSNSIGTITSYSWDFGSGATPATASTEGPHTVSYSTEGFKTVKLVVEDVSGKDSLINYQYVNVTSDIQLNLPDVIYLSDKDTTEIFVDGGDTYSWTPADSIIGSTTSNSIVVSPEASITYYVQGSYGSCSYSDSVLVTIIYAPENDNVCDAISLTLNTTEGPFTNEYATVENNEPLPDTTGTDACTTPLHWCSEGGLQNSVWFTFVAPSTKAVKIETSGFDNQIAVYDAETCEDIVSGDDTKYTLIAANDDVNGTDYDAKIEKVEGLTAGKTYWLQMDGSAGGDVGECTIKVSEAWQTGINNKFQNNDFKVFPNPSEGKFTVRVSELIKSNYTIGIFSIDGSNILNCKSTPEKYEYEFNLNDKGIYIIRITTPGNQYSLPVVIN